MQSERTELQNETGALQWQDLSHEVKELLRGKLAGLWGATTDEEAFNSLSEDKQQALLLFADRLQAKNLWQAVKKIDNVYGMVGVGIDFTAWPFLESALSQHKEFTRRFARRRSVKGGFYEVGREQAVLHFLYHEGSPRQWHVHFDLYSPIQSWSSVWKHLRHEYLGKLRPDWRSIKESLK